MARITKKEHAEYLEGFRKLCPPGTLISPMVMSVSRSGMSRRFRVLTLAPGATEIETHATFYAGKLGVGTLKDGSSWEIAVGGCGMDMRLAVVDNIRWILGGKDSVLIQSEGIRSDYREGRYVYERPAYVVEEKRECRWCGNLDPVGATCPDRGQGGPHDLRTELRACEANTPGALAAYYWGKI